jgi:hypothetical protein
MPWSHDLEKLGTCFNLAIGVLRNDGVVVPQPPIARALQTAANVIQAASKQV